MIGFLVKRVASTSLFKTYGIKPALKRHLSEGKNKLNETLTELNNTCPDAYKATVQNLQTKSCKLIEFFEDEKRLDKIADIVGNHFGDLSTFQTKFENSAAIPKLKVSLNHVINVDVLATLFGKFTKLANFNDLSSADKRDLIKELTDEKFVNTLNAENAKLAIDDIKKEIRKAAEEMCKEFQLNEEEQSAMISIFDDVVTQFLPEFNQIRADVMALVPTYLKDKLKDIRTANPELFITPIVTALETSKKRPAESSPKNSDAANDDGNDDDNNKINKRRKKI